MISSSRTAKAVLLLFLYGVPFGAVAYAAPLAWPPPKLDAPKTILLNDHDDNLDLDSHQDCILKMPKQKKIGHVRITGGRNIVLIGGWSTIPAGLDHQDVNFLILDKPDTIAGRVVHIEGVKVDGSGGGSSDAFHINAPRTIIQLENIRATGIVFNPKTRWHSDLIQPGGGCQELRVDHFTGSSQFQGFYLAQDKGPIGKLDLRHVNICADGTRKIILLAIGGAINSPKVNGKPMFGLCDVPMVNLHEVYLKPSVGQDATAAVLPNGGNRNPGCQSQLSADGKTLSWPSLQHKVTGIVCIGGPPAGDFVPEPVVELDYGRTVGGTPEAQR
jgi:hypothetical protein